MNPAHINHDQLSSICTLFGVRRLYLFGSFASDSARADSDVDVLVDFIDQAPMGAFDRYMGLKSALEQVFDKPVDLLSNRGFRNPVFRSEVERTKVLLYAA